MWKKSTVEKPNPFNNASAHDIKQELSARTLITPGTSKAEMTNERRHILHGQQRVPDIVIHAPELSLASINCGHYEVALCEFLHDFTNCFSNFMDEIRYHLTNQVITMKLEDVHKCAKGERGIYRGCDARLAAIKLSIQLEQEKQQCEELFLLAKVFAELSSIAYSSASQRTPGTRKRLNNLTFLLGFLMKKN